MKYFTEREFFLWRGGEFCVFEKGIPGGVFVDHTLIGGTGTVRPIGRRVINRQTETPLESARGVAYSQRAQLGSRLYRP